MPLAYLPDRRRLFAFGDQPLPRQLGVRLEHTPPCEVELLLPEQRRAVSGKELAMNEALRELAPLSTEASTRLGASVAFWSLACKLALDLVSSERVLPTVERELSSKSGRGASANHEARARWKISRADAQDRARIEALARSMPPAAHAVPAPGAKGRQAWEPRALLYAFLDAAADQLARVTPSAKMASLGLATLQARAAHEIVPWPARWQEALASEHGEFSLEGFAERTLLDELAQWSWPLLDAQDRPRTCFRLELPTRANGPFVLRYLLQAPEDPSLLLDAAELWGRRASGLAKLSASFRDPEEALLAALGRASRLFPPIARSLRTAQPTELELGLPEAWSFLSESAPALERCGFGVFVPSELTAVGQRRLRLRLRVGGKSKKGGAGLVAGASGLDLDGLLAFSWEAALGDETLSARELEALAKLKSPLVRHRGEWVAIDPKELLELEQRLAEPAQTLPTHDALAAALAGELEIGGRQISAIASGALQDWIARLRGTIEAEIAVPKSFRGTLRPYQARGFAWLEALSALGFGACLADDMGLGKTVQILALLLHRSAQKEQPTAPVLLVAPTSVLGNWEREAARFAPSLDFVRHYGPERASKTRELPRGANAVVLTSYGILRRDIELRRSIEWSAVVLDEAQNIKNASAATAQAARALRTRRRFALTGTPVENRLSELWSIFEFTNPGLLGPLQRFRREFAIPIERYAQQDAAQRLRRLVGPFLLRRLKSDPKIVADLPPKQEHRVPCTLTREQASLYRAVVDEELRKIEEASGIARRGRVLALLLALKQICNHPAQYLREQTPLLRRSGKLERVTEMLEEALAEGDKALVFTQFREMGELLLAHWSAHLGVEVQFLHGATPRKQRDEMVRRFQEEESGPRLFLLSVKAGGTGLNLTAASHVFHFDRWWNPAVEDQATDRAHRIGQRRIVQVWKLLAAGTVEEKIDEMLERKRHLAAQVVASGEQWITEMNDRELRELFSLSADVAVSGDGTEANETSTQIDPVESKPGSNSPRTTKPRNATRTTKVRP